MMMMMMMCSCPIIDLEENFIHKDVALMKEKKSCKAERFNELYYLKKNKTEPDAHLLCIIIPPCKTSPMQPTCTNKQNKDTVCDQVNQGAVKSLGGMWGSRKINSYGK